MMEIYETERLILKSSTLEDYDLVLKLTNSPKFIQFIGDRNVKSKEDAENHIKEKMLHKYEKYGSGSFTVFIKENNIPIGTCGIYDRKELDGVDIGFAFLPEIEGKGYAYESVAKLRDIFVEKGLEKLSGITLEENFGSRKLLEKLGLKFQKNISIGDDEEELMLYVWEK
ncbi:GNAT family N-acetyltransferase [Aureivirga sp. CE67]|uniref:GNAT family N-acetyltransferase n=1 Tax=Aureivirga sp. CE67 TaxID=1788983 RepID=UPI0018CAB4A4|nr:GNAT family N-acetyltransferase [Aureivirga sp. CE67]